MKQSSLGLGTSTKRTRRREFLDEMDRVVRWFDLVAEIAPFMPEGKSGRPPFPVVSPLRIHFALQLFTSTALAMEEALGDGPLLCDFDGRDGSDARLPEESTILRLHHVLWENSKLAERLLLRGGTVVDATLISAPNSTKNAGGDRGPRTRQSKKGQQSFFGSKAHIGVDADSGLAHTVRGTSGNVEDVVEADSLVHGQETGVFAYAGYQAAHKRFYAKDDVTCYVAVRTALRKLLDKADPMDALTEQIWRIKVSIRAKLGHPFRVIQRQFGLVKVCYRGLAKNTAHLRTVIALCNLWMVRKRLTGSLA